MVLALWEYEKTTLHRQQIHISCFKDDLGPNNIPIWAWWKIDFHSPPVFSTLRKTCQNVFWP